MNTYYEEKLYPFQDEVMSLFAEVETGFYLTGGTALSREYLHHRYSDDLDFFVNDDPDFNLWTERIISKLASSPSLETQVMLKEERYTRLNLVKGQINLKIELVNDVPSRTGTPRPGSFFVRLDTPENILANKITAVLSRNEPKDIADIWGLAHVYRLSLSEAIGPAQGKAAGIFPVDLARVLCSVTERDWELIRWIIPPDMDNYLSQVKALGESLLLIR